jgi:enhancing lycopene biosynthesis protein 2
MKTKKPEASEYAPFYETYIQLVNSEDIVATLEAQRLHMMQMLAARSEREGNFRYAPDKWSVKEVVGHLADSERIFSYRALRIARGDVTPLPGFEQNDYVKNGGFGERKLTDLSEELAEVRGATSALYRSLGEEAWARRGTASNYGVTVRALAYMTAGHELHHQRILEERYFAAIPRA